MNRLCNALQQQHDEKARDDVEATEGQRASVRCIPACSYAHLMTGEWLLMRRSSLAAVEQTTAALLSLILPLKCAISSLISRGGA